MATNHNHLGSGDFDEYNTCEELTPVTKLNAEPELDNFLDRVNEITSVINALASKDPSENERGLRQADLLLDNKEGRINFLGDNKVEDDPEGLQCTVKQERTLINKVKDDETPKTRDEMSTQAFMAAMEKDAKERAENRKERKVISDKCRKKGNILFAQKDFAGALKNYNDVNNYNYFT